MNGSGAEQPTARRTHRQFYFTEFFSRDSFDTVIVGQQTIDKNVVAFQEFTKATRVRITQEMGEGFINLPTGRGTNALVEFPMELSIELKEVQSLHVQPLMHKAGNELIGTRIG